MKAIMVMYDSLNRHMLGPYGSNWVQTPNFDRLARRSVTFDTCYVGSMPCIPARRELHTGRYNFLHRSWGPLETFDNSVPHILKNNGIYTHLASDHYHYWEAGGATYHCAYSSWQAFRGQEGDPWMPSPGPHQKVDSHNDWHTFFRLQDEINRRFITTESDFPQSKTFAAGLDFIERNAAEDNWFLQIETFDPHEPFFSPDDYKALYDHSFIPGGSDWPSYTRVTQSALEVEDIRMRYAALVSLCDASLGKVLDAMDRHGLWEDTMLIVNTDHGYLLGEHGWWAKSVQPFYEEVSHTPLFFHDPRHPVEGGSRSDTLVQTVDIPATLLEHFALPPPEFMEGIPLQEAVKKGGKRREAALFGIFGGQVNCTDGRWVYMRSPTNPGELWEYTLIPAPKKQPFTPEEFARIQLAPPMPFSKGWPLLRVPGRAITDQHSFPTLLYDLEADPEQKQPLEDRKTEERMKQLMRRLMIMNHAPPEQYTRLGLEPPSADK